MIIIDNYRQLKSNMRIMKELLKKSGWAGLLAVGMLIGSCNDSGDPSLANVKVEMRAVSNLGQLNANGRVMAATVDFQEALVGVTAIEFEGFESGDDHNQDNLNDDNKDDHSNEGGDDRIAGSSSGDDHADDEGGSDDEDEIEFKGEFIVDLINGTSTPDFGIADVVPGVYKEIKIKISPILENGNSILISFEYQPESGDPFTVEYSNQSSYLLKFENYHGIQLEEGQLNQILVLLNLDKLFAGINFSIADVDEDGVVRINATSNPEIAGTIESQIRIAFDAGEDKDGDNCIDEDQQDDQGSED
jgi:hypothetical protein